MEEILMFSAQNKLTFVYNRNTLQVQTELKIKNISQNILEIQIELSNPSNYNIKPNNFYIYKQETKVVEIIQLNYVPMKLDERAKIMYRIIQENSTTSRKNTQTIYHFYKYFFFELSCHKKSSLIDNNSSSNFTQVRQFEQRQNQSITEANDSLSYLQLVSITVSIMVIIIAVFNWMYIKIIKND